MVKHPEETRRTLLETAFYAFHEHGYQASGLDAILASAGVTKGALYHHFHNKKQLGLAVVDEVIRTWMTDEWIRPLEQAGHPIDQLRDSVHAGLERAGEHGMRLGCPLNNLAQEMAPIDEDFRVRIESIFSDWRAAIAAALERGLRAGQVRDGVDPAATATFLVAAFEGCISTVKSSQSMPLAQTLIQGLEAYIEALRAPVVRGERKSHSSSTGRTARKSATTRK